MASSAINTRCTWTCWAIAAAAGVLTYLLFMGLTDMSWAGRTFSALIVGGVLAFFLPILFCKPEDQASGYGAGHAAAMGAGALGAGAVAGQAGADDAASDAAAEAAAKAAADAKAAEDAAAAEAKAAADAAAAEAKAAEDAAAAEAKAAADAKAAEDAAAAEAKAAAEASAAETAEQKAAADAAHGVDYDGDGVREGANEGTRPAALDGPRGGVADDLKRIKGVGPKMEKMCNSLGFYHFDQIAGWTADEVAWVDANLEGFKGRVTRDTWVEQAKLLAAGGETAFSKKVDKGDVY